MSTKFVRKPAIALALALISAQQAVAQVSPRPIKDTTLENGLQIIVVHNPAAPVATAEMVFRSGAFTQVTEAEEGMPHLLEHVLFRSGSGLTGQSFGSYAADLEGSYNGVTDAELVRYYLTVPSKNFSKGLAILSELVRSPDLRPEAIELEKKIVRGEMERKASEPTFLLHVEAGRLLWSEKGWARKNAGGNLLSIMGATPQRLDAFFKRYYLPNNAALIITGDVPQREAFDAAIKVFKGWKRGADPLASVPALEVPALPASRSKMVIANNVYDVTFLVRWQGPSVGKDTSGAYAADVFAGLVNQPLSGTQNRLVESGLFQSVSMHHDMKNNVGAIELMARTSPDKAVAAVTALRAEMALLSAPAYFTEDDMVPAKKEIRVISALMSESADAVAHSIADVWSSAGLGYYRDYHAKVQSRTQADVRRFVDTYIAGKHMAVNALLSSESLGIIGPGLNAVLNAWSVR